MLTPNIGRLVVRRLSYSDQMMGSGIIAAGQMKAGENLFVGEVVHPGTDFQGRETRFKKGQIVYYSEYSAAQVVDMAPVISGKETIGKAIQNPLYVVAEDDVMAYESDAKIKIPEDSRKDPGKTFDAAVAEIKHKEEGGVILDKNGN